MSDLQKPAVVDKRQELCARLGNTASRRIVEIASPKKKTVVTNVKSAAVMTASDETINLNDSESKNITERQLMLPERKMVVQRHEEPTKVYDGT